MIYICTPGCCQKSLSTSHISICCMHVPAYTSQIHHVTNTTPLLLKIVIPFSEHISDWKTRFFSCIVIRCTPENWGITAKEYNLNATCADFFKNKILTRKEKSYRCDQGYILWCVGSFKDKNRWFKIQVY